MTRCTVTVVCVAAAVLYSHWWLTTPDRQRQHPPYRGYLTRWY